MVATTGSSGEGDTQQDPKRPEAGKQFNASFLDVVEKDMRENPWSWLDAEQPSAKLSDYAIRQQAVQEVAKANPSNIQEVAASQLAIINSYYQSGLHQSQQSFKCS